MSINYIFVGQQVCKQAHTHAKLYCTHATVVHLIKAQTDFFFFVAQYSPVSTALYNQISSRL